ncbi:MAG: hypothetical protein RIR12_1678 [Bacteroidota bacterium]|jgi:hypothetical protein
MSNITKKIPYIRVGTQYYKWVQFPLASGDSIEKLAAWSVDNISRDHGKSYIGQIPKYDGFCLIPDHVNFKQIIKNHFNRYEAIIHKPSEGDYSKIYSFLEHIFGEQIETGLDYLTVLYLHPVEKLPVLCLVSKERGTGKTTFLNLLKAIFGGNFTYNTNEDFRSQFNSHWSSKLIVSVDEVLLDKKEDSERIKNLSTAKTYKSEAKGIDKQEVEIICKFILCSNNEDSFIQIEPGETRYWVRKLTPFQKEDEQLVEQMKKQIPAFLKFLITRGIVVPKTTRMWFEPKALETPALKKLIRNNRNRLESQIVYLIKEIMDCSDITEYCFCIKDLQYNITKSNRGIVDHSILLRILKDEWQLKPNTQSSTYTTYLSGNEGFIKPVTDKGRYYTITNDWMMEKFVDLLI